MKHLRTRLVPGAQQRMFRAAFSSRPRMASTPLRFLHEILIVDPYQTLRGIYGTGGERLMEGSALHGCPGSSTTRAKAVVFR